MISEGAEVNYLAYLINDQCCPSCRNHSFDLHCKSVCRFLYTEEHQSLMGQIRLIIEVKIGHDPLSEAAIGGVL